MQGGQQCRDERARIVRADPQTLPRPLRESVAGRHRVDNALGEVLARMCNDPWELRRRTPREPRHALRARRAPVQFVRIARIVEVVVEPLVIDATAQTDHLHHAACPALQVVVTIHAEEHTLNVRF